MDIKSQVKCLVVYAKCKAACEAVGDEHGIEYHGKFLRESLDRINLWADMAEAALALAEHQATSGYDPEVDRSTYVRQRGELWDAFIMARAKAKGVNNEST